MISILYMRNYENNDRRYVVRQNDVEQPPVSVFTPAASPHPSWSARPKEHLSMQIAPNILEQSYSANVNKRGVNKTKTTVTIPSTSDLNIFDNAAVIPRVKTDI